MKTSPLPMTKCQGKSRLEQSVPCLWRAVADHGAVGCGSGLLCTWPLVAVDVVEREEVRCWDVVDANLVHTCAALNAKQLVSSRI